MSKIQKRFSAAAIVFVEILFFSFVSAAQEIEATIKILSPASISVKGEIIKGASQSNVNWTFLSSIAGVENISSRITNFYLLDNFGQAVSHRKLSDGEFLAEKEANVFGYYADLKPMPNVTAMAHASWLLNEHGLLMLDDLLPQFAGNNQPVSAQIKFELPDGWKISSGEKKTGVNTFLVENVEKAIFLVGKHPREQEIKIGRTNLSLAILGEWQFADAEALRIAGELYKEYLELFGELPMDKAQIFLLRFPKEIKFGRWEAETRGMNLTVLSADMPFKTQSVQRLHEQLRHEFLHLWMPNNLALSGNYDWFYEGFAVYQSLRTGLKLNQIRFEDYLDTLSQSYNLDSSQSSKVSLIESSKNRWNKANNQVYARGILAAFLCDIALLRRSKGEKSVSTILREVYQKHRVPNKSENGNAALLKILRNYPELKTIIEKYVTGTENINWKNDLESIGIEAKEENSGARLAVKSKLNGRQKDFLDKLGYNNWRKISERQK
jgi:predicted metalloprotease with PDZ domain